MSRLGAREAEPARDRPAAGTPGVQLEIVASLLVLVLSGLTVVAVVMGSMSARQVVDASLAKLRLGARQLELSPGSGLRSLADVAAFARTRRPETLGGRFRVADERGFWLGYGPRQPIEDPEVRELVDLARVEREVVQTGGLLAGDLWLVIRLRPPNGDSGFLIGRVPREQLLAEFLPIAQGGGWVLLIATLVFVGFGAYLLRRRIVLPLRELAGITARLTTGDLEARTVPSGPAELAELAGSFNDMAESLARQRDALVHAHESLSRSQRLATVGQLAAGVAHEVGNPVAAILGYTEVTQRDAELSERSREMVERIHGEALRIRTLVRELLDLSRPKELDLVRSEPEELLRKLCQRMSAQKLLDDIEIDLSAAPDLPCVQVDRGRFEQILVNLVENAAHALRGQPDARIELKACKERQTLPARRRDDRPGSSYVHRRADDAVAFEVHDNGPGIREEDLPQIFDPFFTTKDPGEGTGLGLWNAHRVAELLGGTLEASSESGRTCFRLILPGADTPDDDASSQGTDHR